MTQQDDTSNPTGTVLVLGTGTMGAGIAHVAAVHGWTARLHDVDPAVAEKAKDGIVRRLARQVEKGRMSAEDADAARDRLEVCADAAEAAAGADLLVEAIVEDLDIKVRAIGALLPHLPGDAIIATNTSSLSVGELGAALGVGPRTVGMHFFNPAPLLKLVEVVPGSETDPAIVDRVRSIAESWEKIVAVARDAPGFIVNHVARPYYLEAFRVLADGVAPAERIDEVMRESGRFRMGPFELTDLIGQDVNTATTRQVWERLDEPPLLEPSPLQESLVADGSLGRKSGRGVYNHTSEPPLPVLTTTSNDPELEGEDLEAILSFAVAAASAVDGSPPGDPRDALAFTRILAALCLQARLAAARGIGTPEDIDTALRYGTNYPLGPLAWASAIGEERFEAACAVLAQRSGERFTWSPAPTSASATTSGH